jgi:isochorismate synthase
LKPVKSKDIASLYQHAFRHGLAFVMYRLPDDKVVRHMTGTVSSGLKKGEPAFAFAPFDAHQEPYYIMESSISSDQQNPRFLSDTKQKSTSKEQYTDLVKKITKAVRAGDFKKIVAARVWTMSKPPLFDPVAMFEKLSKNYPAAFVSLTYIPDVGLWIGASPEILVSETPTMLTTYSLAGTKVIDDNTAWSGKEKKEQQIVTDFIQKKLRKTVSEKINIRGPVTHEAGRLKHLLSVFTIMHDGTGIWKQVVKALHPTPAVAGMPRRKALKYIAAEESFDRSFYAGYLGPVNQHGRTDLFVNLRCMEVRERQLLFYAGCGITADSDPDGEWQESERKIDILRSTINI